MVGRRTEDGWSLDRKVGITGVMAALMFSGALLGMWIKLNDRILQAEIALTYQKGVNDQLKESQKDIKQDTSVAINEVKQSIEKMNNKIDRLLERK